jgi:ferredoxin
MGNGRGIFMRIKVDFDLCQGHANCMGEAPEVFQVDEKGFLNILQDEPPEELREKVELAVKHCPTGAIGLDD